MANWRTTILNAVNEIKNKVTTLSDFITTKLNQTINTSSNEQTKNGKLIVKEFTDNLTNIGLVGGVKRIDATAMFPNGGTATDWKNIPVGTRLFIYDGDLNNPSGNVAAGIPEDSGYLLKVASQDNNNSQSYVFQSFTSNTFYFSSQNTNGIPDWERAASIEWVSSQNYLTSETDPTVPSHVKAITLAEINEWNDDIQVDTGNGMTIEGVTSASLSKTSTNNFALDFNYLDNRYLQGFKQHPAVNVATTGNITLSGTQTIDGIAVVANDRVLVKSQTNASENGVYDVKTGAWVRSSDFDSVGAGEVEQGASFFVEDGTNNNATGWTLATGGTITLGTTNLVFTQYSGSTSYSAGTGLDLTGAVFSLKKATSNTLGGVKVGDNLSVDGNGNLSAEVGSSDLSPLFGFGKILGSTDNIDNITKKDIYFLPANSNAQGTFPIGYNSAQGSILQVYKDDASNNYHQVQRITQPNGNSWFRMSNHNGTFITDWQKTATEEWVNSKNFASKTYVGNQIATKADKTITVTGTGSLTGGGDLTQNRTIDLEASEKTKVNDGETAFTWGNHANAGYLKQADSILYKTVSDLNGVSDANVIIPIILATLHSPNSSREGLVFSVWGGSTGVQFAMVNGDGLYLRTNTGLTDADYSAWVKLANINDIPTDNASLTNSAGYAKTNQLFSKNYNDLTNKPSIPSAANNGQTTFKINGTNVGNTTANQSGNKTVDFGNDFAKTTQLFSKNYNDLTNKPSIPSAANNGTLTIKQDGVSKGTFNADQSTNTTISVDAPHPIDTNAALGNSDTKVPSQKAVKTYVDNSTDITHTFRVDDLAKGDVKDMKSASYDCDNFDFNGMALINSTTLHAPPSVDSLGGFILNLKSSAYIYQRYYPLSMGGVPMHRKMATVTSIWGDWERNEGSPNLNKSSISNLVITKDLINGTIYKSSGGSIELTSVSNPIPYIFSVSIQNLALSQPIKVGGYFATSAICYVNGTQTTPSGGVVCSIKNKGVCSIDVIDTSIYINGDVI